jgi:hypothetical protein
MSEDEISTFAKKATSLIHQRRREDGVTPGLGRLRRTQEHPVRPRAPSSPPSTHEFVA